MGINLGAVFGSLICGYLGERLGFHWGFSAAGVGMVIGLILFALFRKKLLGDIGGVPDKKAIQKQKESKKPLTPIERDRIKVIISLAIFTVIFWAGFEQSGGALNLYTYEKADRMPGDFEVPATWFQSLNALFIVIFAPIFAAMWLKLGDAEPSSPVKFSLGLILLGVGFLFMVGAVFEVSATGSCNMLWLVGAYFFHTLGELCLSPVGLSMVTKLAPLRLGSLFMGVWFLSSAVANKVAGYIGQFTETAGPLPLFGGIAATSIIAGIILYFCSAKLVSWMHIHEKSDA